MELREVVKTSGLTKYYNGQCAVDHLSFDVKEGEIFGFLGPNGAGKTTTILMLLGLTYPSQGSASVLGMDPIKKAKEVKRVVGYLPENVGFYQDLNAIESLQYIADLNGIPKREVDKKIEEALEVVGLMEDAEKLVGNYSRGMRQRLGIAEVLIKDPKVMFLDEPTLGLDPEAAIKIIDLISQLNSERGITVLLSSHNLYQVQKMCTRVGIMIRGKMVAIGTIDELAKQRFGIGDREYTLEEIYLHFFKEA